MICYGEAQHQAHLGDCISASFIYSCQLACKILPLRFSKAQVSILPSMAVVIPWKWISSSARGVFMAGGLKMGIRWEIIDLGSYWRYMEQGFGIKSTVQKRQARRIKDVCMKQK